MSKRTFTGLALIVALGITTTLASAQAAPRCGNSGAGFERWLAQFKQEAVARGMPRRAVERALAGVRYDARVIRLDRNQKSFRLSFDKFWRLRVNNALIRKGCRKMRQYRRVFDRIERRFGVPREIITAIWGLETHYGGYKGRQFPIVQSLATLAYDCRRADFFRNELHAAVRIVARGDMSPRQMMGAWAGEIGQTQFLASKYLEYAVDFDGDRRRDLIRSVPDVLASTANFLRAHGWRPGAGWNPGEPNYRVLKDWNRATVYQQTIARMANMLKNCR